jgi:hypothetical protein
MLNELEDTRVTEQDPDVATKRGAASVEARAGGGADTLTPPGNSHLNSLPIL